MKHKLFFLLTVLAGSMLPVACNMNSANGEQGIAEMEKPDDSVQWDRFYRDSTRHYLLLVKWISDTVIQFDYRVGGPCDYRYICDTAVDKYGWIGCEFIESGDSLLPAHEYLYEGSPFLGIRISMENDNIAKVVSDSSYWSSPMLIHEEPVAM